MKHLFAAATFTAGLWLSTPVWADPFSFTNGAPDGLLGALSAPASANHVETETADDFVLTETTSIAGATVTGLITPGTANIENVEVEVYHVFPRDSAAPSGNVPTRANSPSDFEIDSATRDGDAGTLAFITTVLNPNFTVDNTVVDGISLLTHGEGSASGQLVQIAIRFDPPILLPADRYFFRPEVEVAGGDFLYTSAPKPIPAPQDLQSWIRNFNLKPDWLRIGADIIGPPRVFNQTFSLTGETVPDAGTPGQANCRSQSVSALARQFRGIHAAVSALGFSSVESLRDAIIEFCE